MPALIRSTMERHQTLWLCQKASLRPRSPGRNFSHQLCGGFSRPLMSIAVTSFPLGWPGDRVMPAKERSANVVRSPRRVAGRLATAVSIAAAVGIALPASLAGAASASPQPTLKELLAQAAKLSRQIDSMSQQYDALRIQYDEAKAQVKIAHLTVRRDERLLAADQAAIAQIAAAGYMTGGVNPATAFSH